MKETLREVTLTIKVKAPKRISPEEVAALVDTLVAAGRSDAEASADMPKEDQTIDPTDALSLDVGEATVAGSVDVEGTATVRVFRVFDIDWDVDDEDDRDGLPTDCIIMVEEKDFEPETQIADKLSDKFDFCVNSCSFTELENPKLSDTGMELDDGGVICYPDDEGTIRRFDKDGDTMEVRNPDEDNYREWKELFE